jgi:hypothetical protein
MYEDKWAGEGPTAPGIDDNERKIAKLAGIPAEKVDSDLTLVSAITGRSKAELEADVLADLGGTEALPEDGYTVTEGVAVEREEFVPC